jgi:3-carboxy-cis,cis-muconate cycloisomerase
MVNFEQAWTIALRDAGLVDPPAAQLALDAIEHFTPDVSNLGEGSERDGLPVPALVKQLKLAAGDGASAIHRGATSQDVIDTAVVLCLLGVLDVMQARFEKIAEGLAQLAAAHGAKPLMGRTRMQAANPITVGDRIAAWAAPISAALLHIPTMRAEIGKVQYGGAVGNRAGVDGQGDVIAASLGRTLGLSHDRPVWHSDRSAIVSFGHWLVLTSGALAKIGQDVALMAQQGIGDIRLKGGGGSSAMPHKQNPIRAEVLMALGRYITGQQGILGGALIHEQERSGSAWTLEWLVLTQMTEAAGTSLRHTVDLLDQITDMGSKP